MTKGPAGRCVVALAGRRIDATDADTQRFPIDAIDRVRGSLRGLLTDRNAAAVVCSAACGADLIALDLARELGLRRRIVLPFSPERFRATSVMDRPGEWGPIFDGAIAAARQRSELVVLEEVGEGSAAYAAANVAILNESARVAREAGGVPELAVLVWDGRSRGPGDLTEAFGSLARARNVEVAEVRTLMQD